MSVRAAFATLLTLHLLAACALSECAHAAFAPQFVPRGPLADKGGPQWQQAAVRCSSTHSPARRGLRMGGVTAGEGADAEFVLLDSGNFKRLEQFGPLKVQRPCSAAAWNIGSQQLWTDVDLVYKVPDAGKAAAAQKGAWDAKLLKKVALKTLRNWRVSFGDSGVELMLSAGESGQVGVFAEQLDNWRFIKNTLLAADSAGWSGGPPVRGPATTEDPSVVTSQDAAAVLRVLNGFAYTGGSTLAAARAVPGRVQVTHLDGSKSSVETARQNAAALDLPVSGVRWMTEDCLTFVQREVKRGSKYEALIFDPPAFGRGGRGKGSKVWKLDTDLPKLAALLPDLLSEQPAFVLLSCHDPKWTSDKLATCLKKGLAQVLAVHGGEIEHGPMVIAAQEGGGGKSMPMGVFARWRAPELSAHVAPPPS